jgi:hypothetical protein
MSEENDRLQKIQDHKGMVKVSTNMAKEEYFNTAEENL